ncbi:LOW QUALITY PROTEIN: hypothetical protein QTO34_003005 [Cnephaeus nilssonii]|uniref:BZIP domain-containing protein n=1 Tax=Cnephaeus nilssonii TaxID=3371016 RepID=A0AA40HTC1_CNENI|nr:LOW QUALITY PROTEIN: hypothetical protein QTO34_003005 [Eptesicus nilssonii]
MAPAAWPKPQGCSLSPRLLQGWTATSPAMMPGQIPDPSMTMGSLPGLGPLTRLPSSALTAEELKYTDIHNMGPGSPLALPGGNLELDKEEEWRKRRQEKNKVAAAPCRNKKKEQTEFLQRESEWLELMNVELKTQMEELKQECIAPSSGPTALRPQLRRQPTAGAAGEEVIRGWGKEEKGGGGVKEWEEEEGPRGLFLAA